MVSRNLIALMLVERKRPQLAGTAWDKTTGIILPGSSLIDVFWGKPGEPPPPPPNVHQRGVAFDTFRAQ